MTKKTTWKTSIINDTVPTNKNKTAALASLATNNTANNTITNTAKPDITDIFNTDTANNADNNNSSSSSNINDNNTSAPPQDPTAGKAVLKHTHSILSGPTRLLDIPLPKHKQVIKSVCAMNVSGDNM